MTNKLDLGSSPLESLRAPMYTAAAAARLVGLGAWSVRRWLRGYRYTYTGPDAVEVEIKQGPVVRRSAFSREGYASFVDLVDLLFVRRFLDHGLSLQKIRKILIEAEGILGGEHFAHRTFFTVGSEVFLKDLDDDESVLHLLTGGQTAFGEIISQIGTQIEFDEVTGFAIRWFPFGPDGHIVVDPRVAFGAPSVFGRGITTANVYDMFKGERERTSSVVAWFGLARPEVDAVVRFERQLEVA
ncbi:MAG: hypothetical protein ACC655_04215 [Rhodothermia bacterium]